MDSLPRHTIDSKRTSRARDWFSKTIAPPRRGVTQLYIYVIYTRGVIVF